MRSLGIPTPVWRMYHTGLNMIFSVQAAIFNHPSQHGFRPKHGTDTAWKEIHETQLKANFIHEYDYKKLF